MPRVYIRFAARGADARLRSPLIEGLIARAADPVPVADWRTDAYRLLAPNLVEAPPPAAAAWRAMAHDPDARWVCVATPVHWTAGMSSVTMPADGVVALAPSEAARLAADFNRAFGTTTERMSVCGDSLLLCAFDRPLEVMTHAPDAVEGGDPFGFQPSGPDGPVLRRLMSEIEMWLFDHAINRARSAEARRTITGLWLWGGGATAAAALAAGVWAAGDDVLCAAFSRAEQWPDPAENGVVVSALQPGMPQWQELEQRWLAPAVAALRTGRITRLELSAAERRFTVRHAPLYRFWRRRRPWWESFGMQ